MDLPFVFPLPAGLHARPAALLHEEAARFESIVLFVNRTRNASADTKSTLALISTVTSQGDDCALHIEGSDAALALASLKIFVDRVLPHCDDGYTQTRKLPGKSKFLPRILRGRTSLIGKAVSPGIGLGPAFILDSIGRIDEGGDADDRAPDQEWERFSRAVEEVGFDLEERLRRTPSKAGVGILRVLLAMVRDPKFSENVRTYLTNTHRSAEKAVADTAKAFAEPLKDSDNPYFQERSFDILDIAVRLQKSLSGSLQEVSLRGPTERSVFVAASLSASEFVALDTRTVAALILERGETTSHTVILARAAGIPSVSGIQGATHRISAGQRVIVDANRGLVFADPHQEIERFYECACTVDARRTKKTLLSAALPGRSADGTRLEVGGNCSTEADVQIAIANGADGIGVFRTEIAFAGYEHPPSEEEQLAVYASVVKRSQKHPLIFRTFDIGGDKPVRWLPMPAEENPFLGFRAIRMYDDYPDLVDAQFRAILRAAVHGPVQIMFPMIASVSEVRDLKERLRRCSGELERLQIDHDPNIPVGIMVEIPSAVLQIDHLSNEVEFFSIGSNDLIQYLMAVDRGNERVGHLSSSFHPALFRSFQLVIDGAHKRGKWVGICGELAGDERALPLLLGMGFDEISMSPGRIPTVKTRLQKLRKSDCLPLVQAALNADDSAEVQSMAHRFIAAPGVVDLIDEDLVLLASDAGSKEMIIRELLGALDDEGRIDNIDEVEEAIWQREDTFPTGMGFGFALPHCKSAHVLVPSIAVAQAKGPIIWHETEEPVSLVFLIAIPETSAADTHLKIIAALARSLMHEDFRDSVLQATSSATIVNLVLTRTGSVEDLKS